MIKTIIFDVDGMVIKRGVLPSDKFAKDLDIPIEKILVFFKNEFQLCKTGKADIKEVLNKYLPLWGWKKSTEEFLKYWFNYDSVLNEQMIKSIQTLRNKGIKCCLSTNNEKNRVEYLTNVLGFKDIFDDIFSSDKIGYQKFQQEFWQFVFKKIGQTNKKETLVFDDDEKNVEAAKQFGFSAELYTGFDEYNNKIKKYINKN